MESGKEIIDEKPQKYFWKSSTRTDYDFENE
jgi:hypothetical protein